MCSRLRLFMCNNSCRLRLFFFLVNHVYRFLQMGARRGTTQSFGYVSGRCLYLSRAPNLVSVVYGGNRFKFSIGYFRWTLVMSWYFRSADFLFGRFWNVGIAWVSLSGITITFPRSHFPFSRFAGGCTACFGIGNDCVHHMITAVKEIVIVFYSIFFLIFWSAVWIKLNGANATVCKKK